MKQKAATAAGSSRPSSTRNRRLRSESRDPDLEAENSIESSGSPKKAKKSSKYEGVEVSPLASLFKFDFVKKKKTEGGKSSVTESETEEAGRGARTRGSRSSVNSKASEDEQGRGRRSGSGSANVVLKNGKMKAKERTEDARGSDDGVRTASLKDKRGSEVDQNKNKAKRADESSKRFVTKAAAKIYSTNGQKEADDSTDVNDIFERSKKQARGDKGAGSSRTTTNPKTLSNGGRSSEDRILPPKTKEPHPRGDDQAEPPAASARPAAVSSLEETVEATGDHDQTAPNLEDLMDVGESGPTTNNTEQPTPASNSTKKVITVPCLVDGNVKEYKKLKNASQIDQINVELSAPVVSYILPKDLNWGEISRGVHLAVCFHSNSFKTGYLRIAPRTVKPMERFAESVMCFAVIDGQINVKTSRYALKDNGAPYLQSLKLVEGSFITVPHGAMYSLENWTNDETSLHFCIYTESST